MDGSPFSIPVRQIINAATMTNALVFAAILMAPRFRRTPAAVFLVAALAILASVKADQLFQALGGLQQFPEWGFVLAPFQALMTPILYLLVTATTQPELRLKRGHLWHATPFLLFLAYLFAVYYRFDPAEKAALIATNAFAAPLHRFFVPVTSDLIQLGYVVAALRRLKTYGVTLRNWFSRIDNRDQRWLKRLLSLWGAVFVFHTSWTISAGAVDSPTFGRAAMMALDLVHFSMVTALFLIGVANRAPDLSQAGAIAQKYVGSSLDAEGRRLLYSRIEKIMDGQKPYLDPELTLRDLAALAGATPREVSEAINGVGAANFFDFINRERVEVAKRLLIANPGMRVLDVAYESGFNSKTAFHEAFKKLTELTPSAYRARNVSSRLPSQSVEKSA